LLVVVILQWLVIGKLVSKKLKFRR